MGFDCRYGSWSDVWRYRVLSESKNPASNRLSREVYITETALTSVRVQMKTTTILFFSLQTISGTKTVNSDHGHLEGFTINRIDKQILREHAEGLIGLSGVSEGNFAALTSGQSDKAVRLANEYQSISVKAIFTSDQRQKGVEEQDIVTRN